MFVSLGGQCYSKLLSKTQDHQAGEKIEAASPFEIKIETCIFSTLVCTKLEAETYSKNQLFSSKEIQVFHYLSSLFVYPYTYTRG